MAERETDSGAETGEGGLYRLVEGRHGRFLANPNDLFVGRALIEYGEFSELESELIVKLIPKGGTVIEVGANIGAHTVAIARKVGATGRAHAFEPQPIVFQNLCANLALNGLTNVYAYNQGCGQGHETITFPDIDYTVKGNFGGMALRSVPKGRAGQVVRIAPLDELELARLDFLKVDAEGMEIDVLSGAPRLIARHKPMLYVENDRVERSKELIGLIEGFGYRLWWHTPALFNPRNWAGKTDNSWPRIASFNMLCIHASRRVSISGFKPVDPDHHPLEKAPPAP